MDITHLTYFVTVAKHKIYTKAAQALHVSQPSLSKAVRLLENEWNTKLFKRCGHRIELTADAQAVLPQIENLVQRFEALQHQMSRDYDTEEGNLSLGIPPMVGSSFLSPLIRDFMKAYPRISLQVTEHGSHHIAELIHEGRLQVGFVSLPVPAMADADLQSYIFTKQPLRYVVTPDSPFADYDSVTLDEINKDTFVFLQQSF